MYGHKTCCFTNLWESFEINKSEKKIDKKPVYLSEKFFPNFQIFILIPHVHIQW